jgi:hypothetical protein
MLADFVLELVTAVGSGLTITLPTIAPAGRLTWFSRFGATRQPVYYVLDDTVQEEWGVGTWIPGSPNTITRDQVIGNSAGTTARLNFAATTRCYNAPPSAFLWNILGSNTGRNMFHNPLFRVAQRGLGTFSGAGYTADRWLLSNPGAATTSVSIAAINDASRAVIGDEDANWSLSCFIIGGAGAGDASYLQQRIENVRRTAGKTLCVSFWGSTASGTLKVGIGATQVFGLGGSPSTAVQVPSTEGPVTLTPTWTRYTVHIPMPSLSGKVFGTTPNTDYTQILFWMSSGSTNNALAGGIGVQSGTFAYWGMQCEVAVAPSPLEKPDQQTDLAHCQRFFFASDAVAASKAFCGGYSTAGGTVFNDIYLPVTMRASPSAVFITPVYANASTIAASSVNLDHVRMSILITATGYGYCTFFLIASAEL